jgi:hypothetical protein
VGAAIVCQHRMIRVAWAGMTTPPGPQVKRCFVLQCCIHAVQLWPRGDWRVYTKGHSRRHHRSQAHTHRQLTHSDAGAAENRALTNRSLRAVVHVCDASAQIQILEGVRGQFCKQKVASEPASSACRGLQAQEQAVGCCY